MKLQSSFRTLIHMRSREESASVASAISRQGHEVTVCKDAVEICTEVAQGAGAILIAKDCLTDEVLGILTNCLKSQAPWSHLPIVVFLGEGPGGSTNLRKLEELGHITLLEPPARISTLLTTIRAVLSYRKKQYAMRDLTIELETSRHEAVEANRAKSDFLANMSHEIRTPLGAILGFSELLMDAGVNDREKQVYMTAVKRNGQLLSALIDDILDLAKVESGRIEIAKIEFSLNELLSEVISNIEPQAVKKGLPLVLEQAGPKTEFIVADPIRLKQILVNIVGNAVKFTSHGSVTVRVRVDESEGESPQLKIEVEDTGIGISGPQAVALFKPFTQADTSTTRRFGGTGLGLVLSQKLARAMGGDLQLKWSIPGGGSNFAIAVPVQIVRQRQPAARSELENRSQLMPLNGARILLVDDSLDNQMLISQILKLLGARVDLAGDGLEGVEKALAGQYDVVLMDLQMPRLGGVDATRMLRNKGYTRPIIALTAHALNEDRQRCISVGCTDYLTKPVQRSHLVQVIERVSKQKGAVGPVHH